MGGHVTGNGGQPFDILTELEARANERIDLYGPRDQRLMECLKQALIICKRHRAMCGHAVLDDLMEAWREPAHDDSGAGI